jgi:hypothetical protein
MVKRKAVRRPGGVAVYAFSRLGFLEDGYLSFCTSIWTGFDFQD